jgi:hypothetical protein
MSSSNHYNILPKTLNLQCYKNLETKINTYNIHLIGVLKNQTTIEKNDSSNPWYLVFFSFLQMIILLFLITKAPQVSHHHKILPTNWCQSTLHYEKKGVLQLAF